MYPFPALLTPPPLTPFTTEEITGCSNETANGANKAGRNRSSCFFISCFTVSIISSINTFKSSSDFMILITFKYSFEINQVSPFPALAAFFPLIFISDLFIAFEARLLTNPGKLSLAKGIAKSVITFLPKLPNILRRNLPD